MPVCRICDTTYYYSPCPVCRKAYEEDMREHRIPPQFIAAGKEFTFSHWQQIRQAEAYNPGACYRGFDARERARISYVNSVIERLVSASDGPTTTPEQAQATQMAKIRSRYTY